MKRDAKTAIKEDGKRERAPVKEAGASDNPTQPTDLLGKYERAPVEGV